MAHPMLLQPEMLREGPALPDDVRRREDAALAPCYRSEAFAEDLAGTDAAAPVAAHRRAAGWLFAAPLGTALIGAVLSLFGQQF